MGPGEKILHALHAKSFATILVGVVTELTETYLFKHKMFFPFFTECVTDRFIQALTDLV